MKKLSILVATIAAAVTFTSCETSRDDNPVLPTIEEGATVSFLNAPVMENQYLRLTEDNETEVMHLTCSQPTEYGYAASVRYIPQISLTEDFADFREYESDWSSDCANITITNRNVAEGVCEMLGVQQVSDLPDGYFPVYVRLRADVYTDLGVVVPNTTIMSNVVEFKHVSVAYLAIWVAGVPQDLYLVGTFNGWVGGDAPYQFFTGSEKNMWVTKSFSMAAGETFKVSPASWNAPFNGIAFNAGLNNDQPMPIDEEYQLYVDSNSTDIPLSANFTGIAQLTYKNGSYYLKFIPD